MSFNYRNTYLLDNVGTKLLHRKSTNVASELTDDSIAETRIIEIEDILNNLMTIT